MDLVSFLASVLLVAGALVLLIAAIGVLRLPDALARQHAATKAGTLAMALICIGAMLAVPFEGATWKLASILIVLLISMPVASHMFGRAATREQFRDDEQKDAPLIDDSASDSAAPLQRGPKSN